MYPYLQFSAPDDVYFRDYGVSRFASGVLFKCDMPAAGIEPLFMSNPKEAALLVTPINDGETAPNWGSRRGQIAQTTLDGIKAYFGVLEPTPVPEPGNMHVAKIVMRLEPKGVWTNALAEVYIADETGLPVAGAVVSGEWSGPADDADAVVSNENGVATILSDRTKDEAGTFGFRVIGVTKDDWTYDSGANAENYDEIDF